jgi:protein TonB
MKYLETEHEKRSFVITSVIFVIILLLCFFLGLSYMDPPPENGIAINFDTEDSGGGGGESGSPAVSAPQIPQPASQPTPAADEVATQDVADAPVINKTKPQKETPKQTVKPKEETRKIDQAAMDAMNSVKNSDNANNNSANNVGNNISKTPGKGEDDGPNDGPSTGPYKGGGGGGGTGNYQLAGRTALDKPEPAGCNETGKVVIDITVDNTGRVIKADTGRGTNASPCLISQARSAALNTKFSKGSAEKQVGKITYNFTLTD